MAQYGILVYAPAPADPMSLSPDQLAELEAFGGKVAELGGEIVTGFAFAPSTEAKALTGDQVSDGPVGDGNLVVSGYFVLEAADMATAVRIAQLNPATKDGAVEVRPLFMPPA